MIKIVSFSGGLGNQLFQYLLVVYLRECGHQVYGYYNRKWLIGHNGLEVNNVFDIYLPKTNFIVNALVKVIRVLRCLGFKKYVATDTYDNPIAIFYDGYWQDQKYFNIIDSKLSFKKFDLSAENKSILSKIKSNISVALHIRCGDYLSSSNVEIYGGVCTKEYYEIVVLLICI